MRYFTAPFDMESEDKVIGGYISLRQFFWLVLPIITLIVMLVANKNYIVKSGSGIELKVINIVWRLIIAVVLLINSIVMAFVKIKGENSDVYLMNRIKYVLSTHIYV